jgi:uncharacterized membrane protein YqjE
MSNTTQKQQGGIGFLGILALIFITLKLMGYIKWSWLWVLSPIWIPLAFAALMLVLSLLLGLAGHIVRQRHNKKTIQSRTIISDLDRRR